MSEYTLHRHHEELCRPGLWSIIPTALFLGPARGCIYSAARVGHSPSVISADAVVDDFGILVVVGVQAIGSLQ